MRVDDNQGGTLGYEPNGQGEWQQQPEFREPPLAPTAPPITGITARTRTTTPSPVSSSTGWTLGRGRRSSPDGAKGTR
jgi:hypothetical protein